jgi:hypothetical protein
VAKNNTITEKSSPASGTERIQSSEDDSGNERANSDDTDNERAGSDNNVTTARTLRNRCLPSANRGHPSDSCAQRPSIVILQPQMRDQLLAFQVPERIFQLHQLNEQIVLGIQARHRHRRLKVKAQPLLNPNSLQL